MQIVIINIPEGEHLASLSCNVPDDGLFIGRTDSCQLQLPDRTEKVSERHAHIIQEDNQWYIEDLSLNGLFINQLNNPLGNNRLQLLCDGDILSLGDYRLMISDFSPWQSNPRSGLSAPELPSLEEQAPDVCFLDNHATSSLNDNIDDPFVIEEVVPEKQSSPDTPDFNHAIPLTDIGRNETSPITSETSGLIDVLADNGSDDEDNWSINRSLWNTPSFATEASANVKLSDRMDEHAEIPVLSKNDSTAQKMLNGDVNIIDAIKTPDLPVPLISSPLHSSKAHRKKTMFNAMIKALDMAMTEFSPESMEAHFIKKRNHRGFIKRCIGSFRKKQTVSGQELWLFYQSYHRRLMSENSYRLLFLNRLRTAMKEAESS